MNSLTIKDKLLISLTFSKGTANCNFPWATYTCYQQYIDVKENNPTELQKTRSYVVNLQHVLASLQDHQKYELRR